MSVYVFAIYLCRCGKTLHALVVPHSIAQLRTGRVHSAIHYSRTRSFRVCLCTRLNTANWLLHSRVESGGAADITLMCVAGAWQRRRHKSSSHCCIHLRHDNVCHSKPVARDVLRRSNYSNTTRTNSIFLDNNNVFCWRSQSAYSCLEFVCKPSQYRQIGLGYL